MRLRWGLVDAGLVSCFAVVGRLSHYGSLTLGGWAQTAFPFLVGSALAWALLRMTELPPASLRFGTVVWITTLVCGMALRRATSQGTDPAFVIVATLTLFVLLLGSRAIAALVVRFRGRDARESVR